MRKSAQQLVIRDYPITLWVFGLIVSGFSLFIYSQEGHPLALAIGISAFPLSLFVVSVLTIKADRTTGLLTLTYRFPLWQSVKEIPLNDIVDIFIDHTVNSDDEGTTYTYRVSILLKDNQIIPLRSYYSSNADRHQEIAFRLRQFIGINREKATVQKPLQDVLSSLQQGDQFAPPTQSTSGVHWRIETTSEQGVVITRWHSADLPPIQYAVNVVQTAPPQAKPPGNKWLAGLRKKMFSQFIKDYGLDAINTASQTIKKISAPPELAPYFSVYSNDYTTARQLLNPWTVAPLVNWARKYPFSMQKANQLVASFTSDGLQLTIPGQPDKTKLDDLISLGVELVLAQGSRK